MREPRFHEYVSGNLSEQEWEGAASDCVLEDGVNSADMDGASMNGTRNILSVRFILMNVNFSNNNHGH